MSNPSTLDKIDEQFSNEEDKGKMYIMYIVVAGLIGYLIFTSIIPQADSYFKQNEQRNRKLTSDLISEKNYLARNTKQTINTKRGDLANANRRYDEIKKTNIYVDKKIRELSYLLFDDKNWANFLDSIATTAKKFNIEVKAIRNGINELTPQKIEQILNVEVKLRGSYHSIVKFINALEESMLIVDVYDIKLEGKESIEGLVNIAVWGMKY